MFRRIYILACCMLMAVTTPAQSSLPIIEIRADRTMIYPQRMELTGLESLMDMLQMMPDLMIAGYDELINSYSLRIDNVPVSGDKRLILSQMKAKDIERIQVCDNTGVAKGTIGMGKVLDINMKISAGLNGLAEGQAELGKDIHGNGTVNALYGSKGTDIYANAAYQYQEGDREYVTLHMTNRFDDRNRLLTYFTQQHIEQPNNNDELKVMGRARYFHTFNDAGTELLILGGYQYTSGPTVTNKLPMYVLELNTPLFTDRLSMMLGAEGDFPMTRQKSGGKQWHTFNNDIYLQFTYSMPRWRFTVGNRIMYYSYRLADDTDSRNYDDIRNNTNACVIFLPDNRNQLQLGYYRKYYNPAQDDIFRNTVSLDEDQWPVIRQQLDQRDINQVKLAYAYSKPGFTVQTDASYYMVQGDDNFTRVYASAYWKSGLLTLTGGANMHIAPDNVYASLRLAPTLNLPHTWQIGMQMVYYTGKAPYREEFGTPVYGCLSVSKQFGSHWQMGLDWHDMFDAWCSEAKVNRHAANLKLQYRF